MVGNEGAQLAELDAPGILDSLALKSATAALRIPLLPGTSTTSREPCSIEAACLACINARANAHNSESQRLDGGAAPAYSNTWHGIEARGAHLCRGSVCTGDNKARHKIARHAELLQHLLCAAVTLHPVQDSCNIPAHARRGGGQAQADLDVLGLGAYLDVLGVGAREDDAAFEDVRGLGEKQRLLLAPGEEDGVQLALVVREEVVEIVARKPGARTGKALLVADRDVHAIPLRAFGAVAAPHLTT